MMELSVLRHGYYSVILCCVFPLKCSDVDLLSMFRKVHDVPSYFLPEAVYAIYRGARKYFLCTFGDKSLT